MNSQELRRFKLLTLIESTPRISQRRISEELGISLGTAHNLIQSLAGESLIEIERNGRNCKYRLTDNGRIEKLRLLNRHHEKHLDDYVTLRDRIGAKLAEIDPSRRRVVFYGTGNLAEVAYIAAHIADFELIGVVDDQSKSDKFLGHSVIDPGLLSDGHLNGKGFDTLVVASQSRSEEICKRMEQVIATGKVCCL